MARAQAPGLEIEEVASPAASRAKPVRADAAPRIHLEKIVAGTYMAAASADGKTIVSGEPKQLRVVTLGGSERVLRRDKHIDYNGLDISAAGSLVHHRDGAGGVWLYDAHSGRELTRVESMRSALTPTGELLWWEDNSALARESHRAAMYAASLSSNPDPTASSVGRMYGREPQARPGSCQLHRRRVDGTTQRLWLSECRDIVMVAEDGSFAVIGQGGAPHRYDTYDGGRLMADYFETLVRVDLRTGERVALGGHRLSRPKVSGDGRTVCGSPHDEFARGQRELVRCQRDGGRVIEMALPRSPRWTLLELSHDGRWLAASTIMTTNGRVEREMHVLPIATNARPVFTVPGQMLSWLWLPGSQRVALSVEHADVASAYLVDVAEGWSARLGDQRRSDQMVGLRAVGERSDEMILVRTRGAKLRGADVWRVTIGRSFREPQRSR